MTVKKRTICDNCGKESEQPIDKKGSACTLPVGWLEISRMELKYHRKLSDGEYRKKSIGDPHFCSEACIMAWFIRQIKGIKEPEKKRIIKNIKKKLRR